MRPFALLAPVLCVVLAAPGSARACPHEDDDDDNEDIAYHMDDDHDSDSDSDSGDDADSEDDSDEVDTSAFESMLEAQIKRQVLTALRGQLSQLRLNLGRKHVAQPAPPAPPAPPAARQDPDDFDVWFDFDIDL